MNPACARGAIRLFSRGFSGAVASSRSDPTLLCFVKPSKRQASARGQNVTSNMNLVYSYMIFLLGADAVAGSR